MVVREYICLDFSRNNEDYLFAGSSSGDFIAIQLKSKTLSSIVPVASKGVTAIQCISQQQLILGCGDGTLATYSIEGNKFLMI